MTALPVPGASETTIRVEGASDRGPFKPIWAYFGYDEPNYTYTQNGARLIGELAATRTPVYIRTHNLLTTGDGTAALKWGSTNAYTEDARGNPVYDWAIVDRIFDTYVQARAKPFVEIGFMPKALSRAPEPYQHAWPKFFSTGWADPPTDYKKWGELVNRWVQHSIARYGLAEVDSWYWEVWNEPNIGYWRGTPEEFFQLYDYAVDAVKRAAPGARVGGPATTGPAGGKAAAFLRAFLEHCAGGRNFATGVSGAPLDFITYHAKGQPNLVQGHVQMGLGKNLEDVAKGMEIVTSFPKFHDLPIILSESDPEGCAACSAVGYPQNAYRNGALYPTYTAAAISNIFGLADRYHANIEGVLTWAFEFENQPYFAGFRTLATNGIDKPILNFFRMAGMMSGRRLAVASSAGLTPDAIIQSGVRQAADVNAMAARSGSTISVMLWNYHDDDVPGPEEPVHLKISGVRVRAKHGRVRQYRIDRDHSNAYTVWRQMGSPQHPTAAQMATLEAAAKLAALGPMEIFPARQGTVDLHVDLPRQSVSLIQLSW